MKKRIPKRVVFLTGTRADFGKLKPLIGVLERARGIEVHIFATGMHVSKKYGTSVIEVERAGFRNVHRFSNDAHKSDMARTLAKTVDGFSVFVQKVQPALIIVHGDRIEALAGALVGAVNNVLVGHVEGGEVSGTVDEHLRHAISKLSHVHFVANANAKKRLIQMGEKPDSVFVIGSPDIDVMRSGTLPSLAAVRERYDVRFPEYGIVLYHPVVTELDSLREHVKALVDALIRSGKNYVVIYPNNDPGTDIILDAYRKRLSHNPRFRIFPSMRFEYFLTLLKNTRCVIGNSSAGIREAPFYGVPSVNIGTRQNGRLAGRSPSVKHVGYQKEKLAALISGLFEKPRRYRKSRQFGDGKSSARFLRICRSRRLWELVIQKTFIDLHY